MLYGKRARNILAMQFRKISFADYFPSIGDTIAVGRLLWDTTKAAKRRWHNASIFTKYKIMEFLVGTLVPTSIVAAITAGGTTVLYSLGLYSLYSITMLGALVVMAFLTVWFWSQGYLETLRHYWIDWVIPVVWYKCLSCGWDTGIFTQGEPKKCIRCKSRWKVQGTDYLIREQHTVTWK